MLRLSVFAAFAVLAVGSVAAQSSPQVTIDTGVVQGDIYTAAGGVNVEEFLGIPYAADTGGANRFMAPQKRAPWAGVLHANKWGDGCYQTHHNADVPKNISEDCLNLNVWRPAGTTSSDKLPVMIFWHGGSFAEGSNQGPFYIYRGANIAARAPVIVVSANYRLGALGFVVTDQLKGNNGLLDQRASLEWLQRNIAAFGGDPSRVTIWGESAGAMSAGIHLIMEDSKPLFQQVIMESNVGGYRYRELPQAQVYGNAFCSLLNCSTSGTTCDTQCMQKVPATTIGWAWNKAGNNIEAILLGNWNHWLEAVLDWDPVVDGTLVPMEPIDALAQGKFDTSKNILMGTNANEGTTFIYAGLKFDVPTFIIEIAWDVIFGSSKNADKVKAIYNESIPGAWDDGRDLMSQVITDFWFRCASEQFLNAVAKDGTGNSTAWMYRYNHVYSDSRIFSEFGIPVECLNRTCHAAELPFVFQNTVPSLNATFTPAELVLSDSFINYWTSFVQYGDPNQGNKEPLNWPEWDPVNRENIVLNLNPSVESSAELCQAWDEIGYDH